MTLLEIFRVIERDPHFAAGIFPDQRLQRQINGNRRRSNHHRRARLRASEEDELRWVHFQPDLLGFAAVIHAAKYRQSLLQQQRLIRLRVSGTEYVLLRCCIPLSGVGDMQKLPKLRNLWVTDSIIDSTSPKPTQRRKADFFKLTPRSLLSGLWPDGKER